MADDRPDMAKSGTRIARKCSTEIWSSQIQSRSKKQNGDSADKSNLSKQHENTLAIQDCLFLHINWRN